MSFQTFRRALEAGLIGLGVSCLVWSGSAYARSARFQHEQAQVLACGGHCAGALAPPPAAASSAPLRESHLVGRLEIPRLDVSVIVMNGDDDETLATAAGHLPDTPMPWQWGNTVIAAHRDTFFRPLRHVQPGDQMRLVSTHGTFLYRVRDARVVTPADVSVLSADAQPTLTLVTCYPFYYVGNAPKRYVVRADLIASTPPLDDVR